jgi:hypothetical protein
MDDNGFECNSIAYLWSDRAQPPHEREINWAVVSFGCGVARGVRELARRSERKALT